MAGGVIRRAPKWVQQAGAEWAYRLCQEPRRLWRRYLVNDLPFLATLVFQTLSRPRPSVQAAPTLELVRESTPMRPSLGWPETEATEKLAGIGSR